MQIDSSARRTGSDFASAVEWAMTVRIPISRQVRMIRSAISPRLAMRILWNTDLLRLEHRGHALPLIDAPRGSVQRPAIRIEVPEGRLGEVIAGKLGVLRDPLVSGDLLFPDIDDDLDGLRRHIDVPDRHPVSAGPRDSRVQQHRERIVLLIRIARERDARSR